MGKDYYCIHDTCFSFVNETERQLWCEHHSHYGTFHRVLNMLKDNGFDVWKDRTVPKILQKDHYAGQLGDLKFKAERYSIGFKIDFYQDVSAKNPNGGYYDFDKFRHMPYIIRLQYMKYMKKIVYFMNLNFDVEDKTVYPHRLAEDKIKADYVRSPHYPQTDMDFNLSDLDGMTPPEWNGTDDRDGRVIHNGEVKYFRNYDGRLYRGKVYHHINNMWWVILNRYEVRNIACFELFDLSSEDNLRRMKDPSSSNAAQKYRKHLEKLSEEQTKDLVTELKRRGYAVKIERK